MAFSWYAMQDTPGYGDDTDVEKSIRMIVDQNEQYSAMPRDHLDTPDLASREDPRVSRSVAALLFV
jgi:hypothetical protein